jgi:hypothetical protein
MPADGLESEEDNEPVSTGYQPEQVKEAAGHARLRPGSRGEEDRGGRVVVIDQHYFIFYDLEYCTKAKGEGVRRGAGGGGGEAALA